MNNSNSVIKVKVFSTEIDINKETGHNFDLVLKKMEPSINLLAKKYFIPGYGFSDMKQELMIMAIAGIKNYNPESKSKLSSFLYVHLKNKIIAKILTKTKGQRHAVNFSKDYEKKYDEEERAKNKTKYRTFKDEVFSCSIVSADNESFDFISNSSSDDGVFSAKVLNQKDIEFKYSLNKILNKLENIEPETKKIIEYMIYEGYTIEEAAEKIGIGTWAACEKLRRLSRFGKIKELFGKRDV